MKRKPIEDRKSFIGEISPKDNLVSRTMTAVVTGQIAGTLFGAYVPWGIVIGDGIVRKKPFSWSNLRDYSIFKASAALMNPGEIQNALEFVKDKYQLIEPHLEHLTNYL